MDPYNVDERECFVGYMCKDIITIEKATLHRLTHKSNVGFPVSRCA